MAGLLLAFFAGLIPSLLWWRKDHENHNIPLTLGYFFTGLVVAAILFVAGRTMIAWGPYTSPLLAQHSWGLAVAAFIAGFVVRWFNLVGNAAWLLPAAVLAFLWVSFEYGDPMQRRLAENAFVLSILIIGLALAARFVRFKAPKKKEEKKDGGH